MFYLVPQRLMRSLDPGDVCLPAGARFGLDAVSWVPMGGRTLAIHRPTGVWVYADDRERSLLASLEGRTVREAAVRCGTSEASLTGTAQFLWRRGLLSASGQRAVSVSEIEREMDEAAREVFALMLVMSPTCSLACRYCYLDDAAAMQKGRMTFEAGADAIRRTLERGERHLIVDFGEIAGSEELFCALVEEARRCADRLGRNPSLLVQTAGTRLEPELVSFLVQHGIQVGLSLDGPARLHDLARRFHNGRGTHAAAVRTLSVLLERGIPHWVFATIARHNVVEPAAVLDHFFELGAQDVTFKAVLPVGVARRHWAEVGITMHEYTEFVRTAVRLALGRGLDSLDIGHRRTLFRVLGDRRGWMKGCVSRNCHCGEQLVVVASDGRWVPCPRFSADGEQRAGLVTERATRGIGVRVPDEVRAIPEHCAECPWVRFCGGGCALAGPNDPQCESYDASCRALFEDVIPYIVERRVFQPGRTGPFRRVSLDPWSTNHGAPSVTS